MTIPTLARPENADAARRAGDPRSPLDPAVAASLLAPLTRQEIERADIDYYGIMTATGGRRQGILFDRCVGSLGVLGYSRPWLADRLRMDERLLTPGVAWRRTDRKLLRRVLTAAVRIGSRWATPESTGQTAEQIRAVHEQAVKDGFLVPASYGPRYQREGMMELPRDSGASSGPAHPGVQRARVAAKIRAVAYFCEHGGSERGVGDRFGLADRTVGRTRREDLGIEVMTVGLNRSALVPGQEDIVAEVIKAANAIAIGEDPHAVWSRLYSYAAPLRARRAAVRAAGSVTEAWTEQGFVPVRAQHTEREDSAA